MLKIAFLPRINLNSFITLLYYYITYFITLCFMSGTHHFDKIELSKNTQVVLRKYNINITKTFGKTTCHLIGLVFVLSGMGENIFWVLLLLFMISVIA